MGEDGPDYSNIAAGGQVNVTHPLHVEQHEDGGEDELNVGGLSGELADEQLSGWAKVSGKPSTFDPLAHKTSHQNGGTDEISVAGLSGELADAQPSAWAKVSSKPSTFDPSAHKTSHQNGGTDEISVAGLSGELADDQPAKAHKVSHENAGSDEISLEGLDGVPAELFVVAAIYNTSAEQSIPNAAYTVVDFGTKVQDTHNAVTTGAAWKFTAPVAGFYQISVIIMFDETDTWADGEVAVVELQVNSVRVVYFDYESRLSLAEAEYVGLEGSILWYLSAGDILNIVTLQNSGAALNLISPAGYNYVSIVKFAGS